MSTQFNKLIILHVISLSYYYSNLDCNCVSNLLLFWHYLNVPTVSAVCDMIQIDFLLKFAIELLDFLEETRQSKCQY